MRKKLFGGMICFALAVAVLMGALTIGGMYVFFDNKLMGDLRSEADSLGALLAVQEDPAATLAQGVYAQRVTLVAADGTVLYDNRAKAADMENHAEREEIAEALANGEGDSRRDSSTLGEQSVYYARRLNSGMVLRVSGTQKTVLATVSGMVGWLVLGVALSVALAALFARPVTQRLVKPINDVNLDEPLESDAYEELSPMLRRMDAQNKRIAQQMGQLTARQNELDAIIGSMREGLVILDAKHRVLAINHSACTILGTNGGEIGQLLPTLNRHETILRLLKTEAGSADGELASNGRTYRACLSMVPGDGMVLLLQDVTSARRAEESRRQFSSNVSHELRTPLTTISGYAELLSMGMTKPEDAQSIGGKVYKESQRLLKLIEDILRLSKLDEGVVSEQHVLDLMPIAKACVAKLGDFAAAHDVKLHLSGESACVLGDEALLEEMLTNLIENGVKYNRKDGDVFVTVGMNGNLPFAEVRDTGVGIAPDQQERVFERFYRVDKSRSKETGGTGLGLSIVKHGAQVHHADIEMKSALGQGTDIMLVFPAN